MEKTSFGRTGLEVSRLTFGCGAVGGLMTKGDAREQDRAVAWARDHGINFFDTAASYGESLPAGYPAEDYRQLLGAAVRHGVGSIGVRVLAGGALSGSEVRHPLGLPVVTPIGSNADYATDVQRALRFAPLVEAGFADSLPNLAIRYAISNPDLSTTEIGIATIDELQHATAAVNIGPLPEEALDQIREIQAEFVKAGP